MKKCVFILFIILICLYKPWFTNFSTLSSGDWPYLFPENIKEFSLFKTPFLWLDPYYRLTAKFGIEYLSLQWEVIEKIFWFYPFILISVISSWVFVSYFLKVIFRIDRDMPKFIGTLIYTTNTYILMIVGGGQMGVAMAYALAPLALLKLITFYNPDEEFRRNIKDQILNIKYFIITSLILAVQLMFDPRVFSLTLFAGMLFILIQFATAKQFSIKVVTHFFLLTAIAIVLNLFWILPNFDFYQTHYEDAVNAVELDFLSFAQFSNALSLLHPNWPENLFGKTYFLRPEFLLLPMLAFSSLLFLNNSKLKVKSEKLQFKVKNLTILFFVFLGLLGSFLAKGVNPPFGELNSFLYETIPGMSIFRDPTKFYLLIILSYSVLIPYSLTNLALWTSSKLKVKSEKLQFKIQKYIPYLFFLLVTCYLLLLIRPAWMGQLSGTFKPKRVPQEYISLKEFLKKDTNYSPVLWIPYRQRFGFYSDVHPAIEAQDIVGTIDSKEFANAWKKAKTIKLLKKEGIVYVILPYDSEKEIFLSGYSHATILRSQIEEMFDGVRWLKKVQSNEKIDIYKIADLN